MFGYKKRSKDAIQLIDKLRDAGVSSQIDLPTVVLYGHQSAGKSRLVDSLADIVLPRPDSTCIGCPIELRLCKGSDEWECGINLHFLYNSTGEKLARPRVVEFQTGIRDKSEAEAAIKRAQRTILSPTQDSDFTVTEAALQNDQMKLSKNTICIKITGSTTNLTFVDLPGLIGTNEEHYTAVLDVVRTYISNPRALLVATFSCSDAIDYQDMLLLAKEYDPQYERTVGVLTNAESDTHNSWLQILTNRRIPLDMGYYIVMTPNANISLAEAQNEESAFFRNNTPWNSVSADVKACMGVCNLRKAISTQYVDFINDLLSSMRDKVQDLIDALEQELSKFPAPLSKNPKVELTSLVHSFTNSVKELIEIRNKDYHRIDSHFKAFHKHLADTHPKLILPNKGFVKRTSSAKHIRYETEEDLEFGLSKEQINEIMEQHKGREISRFIQGSALNEIIQACQVDWRKLALECLANVEKELKEVISAWIHDSFKRFRQLPRYIE
ncbi:hypothetical protein DSO57_1026778 [Entomophthora muscae]|uniref:Uncharacterized protein n=1 Tax=Entomophthora muscae TaxID=34485 RepID=A0ACC2SEU7_9FUNG|nr:hypothetical protein DSO57_1026778 [Entomophthora muscae]